MFNLGSDDKDELQENMKEIKNMIQREGEKSRAQQGSRADTDFGGSGNQKQQGFGSEGGSKGFGNESSSGQNSGKRSSSEVERRGQTTGFGGDTADKDDNLGPVSGSDMTGTGSDKRRSGTTSQPGAGRSTQPGQNQQSGSPQSPGNREKLENHSQEPQENDTEEKDSRRKVIRSEPKKESSDSTSDEPLFLREEQFRDVREMVEEMSYLSQEISENLDGMRKSVKKERDNSQNVGELVDAYSQRRSSIESTIKSGQK